MDAMPKTSLKKVQSDISLMLQNLDISPTNRPESQELALDLYLGAMLQSLGKNRADRAKKELKRRYSNQLEDPSEKFELMAVNPFKILAKVNKPRETFDKERFIQEVSQQYEIPAHKLFALADTTVKKSAAPVSFECILND